MKTRDTVITLFNEVNELSVKEIVSKTSFSKQMVHLVLNKLVEDRFIEKLGLPPKTIYRLIKIKIEPFADEINFSKNQTDFLDKAMIVVTETGNLLNGKEAFIYWCKQRKDPIEKTLTEFVLTKQKYEQYYEPSGIINGTAKLKSTEGYDEIWVNELYYLDFYAIERFGKTKLGTLLHYAKQGQNKFLMNLMMLEITERIKTFLKALNADAIGFVPPTIRREVQIMKFIQTRLNISLPVIDIKKINGLIPIPQKSLSKLNERIKNAENSFAITEQRIFNHIVLIDDAVGSGSTLNQIAGKIKNKGLANKITGLAIVGSFKGFDVVTDV